MIVSARYLLSGCCALLWAAPALAVEPYATNIAVPLQSLLPPPPAKGSPADIADLRAVLDAQSHASAARKAQALADSKETMDVMFGQILGAKFVLAELPKTSLLFERIGANEDKWVDSAKPAFARPRPWIAHPEVLAVAKPTKSGSYPSGHATRVVADAIVLAAMVPEKQSQIWARAEDYGTSRVIGGAHYPTDVQAGWLTGTTMAALLFQQPEFRADFEAAKTELRAQLGIAPTN